ncbi:hypothetical protein CDAR_8801 [Caerostris darwini]|uniref:Uncharacterized protein n=1 Tax=Caerostris darwini TaxID=1538125 RepID=A0AAV4R4B1_9ARAC|nr:hypothetical protein CDAR_8801 [Caerostris darwini]
MREMRTACNHITVAIDNFNKTLKDSSNNKKWKCLATEGFLPVHLEHSQLSHAFALQLVMITCRHTSTVLV